MLSRILSEWKWNWKAEANSSLNKDYYFTFYHDIERCCWEENFILPKGSWIQTAGAIQLLTWITITTVGV